MLSMQETEKNIDMDSTEARIYEVSYLLVPSIEENDLSIEYGNMKELIASLGGEIIADEMPKRIELAYTMSKVIQNIRHNFDNAYFGWFKFAIDPEKVLELKKKLDLDIKVIRFLIVKTVRENTIATKKFARVEGVKRYTKDTEKEEVTEINKEEIDKEIDAMVTEA